MFQVPLQNEDSADLINQPFVFTRLAAYTRSKDHVESFLRRHILLFKYDLYFRKFLLQVLDK